VYGRNPSLPGVSDATTGSLETITHSEIVKAMFHRMENTRIQCQIAKNDHRLKTAIKNRLPKETDIAFSIGDDGKDGKLYHGRIIGCEGPTALIKWGNSDRRVPSRELLPRWQICQDSGSEPDTETEDEIKSETESIPEIRPKRRGPQRKIFAFKIKKPREKKQYKEGEILPDLWTDEEEDTHLRKVNLSMSKKGEYVNMWGENGNKFSGKVIQ